MLLTATIKDFPPDPMRGHGIELLTPDDFLLDALDINPRGVQVLGEQVAAHRRPPRELQGLSNASRPVRPALPPRYGG